MLNIYIDDSKTECEAYDISDHQLFVNGNEDLCLRVTGGAIKLTENNIAVYSNDDLQDKKFYPSFQSCHIIKGEVSIKVNL